MILSKSYDPFLQLKRITRKKAFTFTIMYIILESMLPINNKHC